MCVCVCLKSVAVNSSFLNTSCVSAVNTTDCYSGSNPSYTQHPAFQASAFVSVPGQANQSCLWVADIGGNLSYVNAPISANDIIVVEVEGRAVLALDESEWCLYRICYHVA